MSIHSIDEQMTIITERACRLQRRQRAIRRITSDAVCAGLCLFLLIVSALYLPGSSAAAADTQAVSSYGSLILGSAFAGYILTGVLAFGLGVFITLFCIHWRAMRRESGRQS